MASIVLIGGGGHARVVIDAVRARGEHSVQAIVDVAARVGESVDGVPIVGTVDDLARLRGEGAFGCVIAVGSVGDPSARIREAARARQEGLALLTVVHPAASVSTSATLGEGVFVGAGAVVGAGALLGECAIINSAAVVDHDCSVGAFAHIAPGAALSGGVTVGDRAHVGTGASVMQGVRIGADSVVGVGSAVVRDVPDGATAFGNPCRVRSESGR